MKIDKDMLGAFEAGKAHGAAGGHSRDNPYLYTSAMSDAWEMGRRLVVNSRLQDIGTIVGLSTRGLTYRDREGRQFRWRVSYVPSTQGHEIWRAVA